MKDKIGTMAQVFKALGDQKRLQIIKMLVSNENDTFCVTDVANKLNITQPAASQHIKILKNINLLEENRKGFRIYYTINRKILQTYKNEIDQLFKKSFEKCPHDYSCSECSFNNSCG
jgi:ArsR family transcriptional regulator